MALQTRFAPVVVTQSSALLFLQPSMPSHARIKCLTQRTQRPDTESTEKFSKMALVFLYVRAARPFGALKDCNDALSNFSKLPAPFSRRASAAAPSAARAS